ncbi:hypothetical protein VFPPC_17782 [Pochonia chlamydosporia 170]|uniref:Uncharacterized protein n=1 Tax=Pochonia chlamydosporia 170 TaxID=1380566 RepID=A0A179EWY0_METCM|nr:hypothetical protein VFPPC_17782 [Pochonia chlamydosporia 170]XP_022283875.1 hypothetical protein VFPPC_12419 [Pochonia chlamydosporia 170]OAQ57429.1 hypothetical protein VFPPC_12419 [Pochonia chlamydosporia 170]OWT43042.1 hypothetical protein VFPPC_17782 [Pochonia chlamydosporia 170]
MSNDTIQARTYVSNFYAGGSPGSATTRSVFVKPSLPYTTNQTAPCPVPASNRCLLGSNLAYSVTTDMLDSQTMLGIDAPERDRVALKLSVTCSPLRTTDLVEKREINNRTFLVWHLGMVGDAEHTFLYNTETPRTGVSYKIATVAALAPGFNSSLAGDWKPIADFNRTDAHVSVFFLSQNNLGYFTPVSDPWFSANVNVSVGSINLFHTDSAVTTIGCAEQYQMCNPQTGTCTKPAGYAWLRDSILIENENTLGLNFAQRATASRLVFAIASTGASSTVQVLGTGALWANSLVFNGNLAPGMPDNQWQAEVLGWFQTSLARIQAYVVDFASNAGKLGALGSVLSPHDGQDELSLALRRQCRSQLVQTVGEVQNFNFVGVAIVICFSSALILLDLVLEPLVSLMCRRRNAWRCITEKARQADNKLHLLRMALANKNGSDWELGSRGVPVRSGQGDFERPVVHEQRSLVSYEVGR